MNRFPKMMILWKVYFEEVENLEEPVAMALGHAVATSFAIAKNFSRVGRKSKKKGVKPVEKKQEIAGMFKPIPYIPHKGVYLTADKHGVYYSFKPSDKPKNGAKAYLDQVKAKFTDTEQYKKYEEFAREIVSAFHNNWKRKWWKIWQKIRDLDWDKYMPETFIAEELALR